MPPILTLTLNPALDLAVDVPQVVAGPKLRCSVPQVDPGGGGVNVSRVIHRLGGETVALIAIGGATGARLGEALGREGVAFLALPAAGETRETLTVTEARTGAQYRFVLPGPRWRRREVSAALAQVSGTLAPGQMLVLSGSLPPGVPADFALTLARRVRRRGAWLAVDTSGAPLARIAHAHPGLDLLRMDGPEAEELAGRHLPTASDSADFAESLVRNGTARQVVVARGAEGSVLAGPSGRFIAAGADVPVRSRTGAGDSFMAAMVLALLRGKAPEDALRHGMAAASAAVMTGATELCRPADVRRLLRECAVRAI